MNARTMKLAVIGIVAALLAQAVPAGADEVILDVESRAKVAYKAGEYTQVLYQDNIPAGCENGAFLRGLYSFDVDALTAAGYNPATHKIDSLTLNLSILATNGTDPNNYIRVHAVSQTDGDWATDSSQGYGAAFVTYDTTVLGTTVPYPTAGTTEVVSLSGIDLTALVNSWISGKNAGFDLVGYDQLIESGKERIVTSSPSTTLTVAYSAIPEPATMAMLGIGGIMMLVRRRRKIAG